MKRTLINALTLGLASSAPSAFFPEDARFFAKVHVNIVASAPSFGSFYNTTNFWVRDEGNQRERLDQSTNTRFLTFSPQFGSTVASVVTANSTVYSSNLAARTCTSASLTDEDSVESDRGFPGSAAVGSMRRFLPDTTAEMGTNPQSWVTTTKNDTFVGYVVVETPYTDGKVNCTVWGWEDVWSNGLVFASHMVYVSIDTGLPVRETQMEHASSYPPSFEANFEYDAVASYDDWESYFDDGTYGAGLQLFGRPAACQPSAVYGQCGGFEWRGSTECASGATCSFVNEWYSQCLPARN
uniref:CBM1 domain-containing protein n=1 Tax=Florenciella parvula TaxID=236787 RepID=A0A7S2CZ84_9STRA|mmetsp:Transcript_7186/g.14913  ORF Transcript_7186/g.14913 Transcript_7186/m.14913 type:complete len:297 (+) Transcript_7186:176-1066(+)|eukprot:CAMPEP_0182524144 /NCGR_PEP_ID=MMETSP1323-20130603/1581_1 /TAXON_ID=236787 /ORGANISM="Florenciella parvula, Strain RCC1693" /LENGTH=296 /DNA_ID=CAMNT_0024732653 /DNA_START=157 /DNA_END=1047 /DNA_ORIENTATION=+